MRWPLPLAEAEWVVEGWLAASGFAVTKDAPESSVVRLSGSRGAERREVLLQPNSPLATCVRAGGTPDPAREKELSDLLGRYLAGALRDRPLADDEVPGPVLARRTSAVCIEAHSEGRTLRFSGFALDRGRQILTTAHDLGGVSDVTVTWEDGHRARGRLVRSDPRTDLALVELEQPPPTGVSLKNARGVLAEGEPVYSIGCPSGTGESIRSGRVRPPMVKVGPLHLWAVEMETLPGGSGSPVFDARGNLAGVVKGRLRGTEDAGFLIPVEALLRFLENR